MTAPLPSSYPSKVATMNLRKHLGPIALALGILSTSASASADDVGLVQRYLRGPFFQPSAATLRIQPPPGGHAILHRNGKPVRWFMIPAAVQVEPGATYALTAVRGDQVIFDTGIMARPGVLDVVWGAASDAPQVAFQPPAVLNPFGVGLVPIGAAPVQSLRSPIGDNGFALMLDDLQTQLDDASRWMAFTRYTQQWLFTEDQIRAVVDSFRWPYFREQAHQILQRRRVGGG